MPRRSPRVEELFGLISDLNETISSLRSESQALSGRIVVLEQAPGVPGNTGLLEGGVITTGAGGPLDIEISGGSGFIYRHDQTPEKPFPTRIRWGTQTVTIVPTTGHAFTVHITEQGTAVASEDYNEVIEQKDNILIRLGIVNLTSLQASIDNIINAPIAHNAVPEGFIDFLQATDQLTFGADGFDVSGVSALQRINVTDGTFFSLSAAFRTNPLRPNFFTIAPFSPVFVNAQIDRNGVANVVGQSDIPVHRFDNNGTIEEFGNSGGQSGLASIQRLYLADGGGGTTVAIVQLGQQTYSSLDEAVNSIFSDNASHEVYPGLENAAFIAFIVSERGGTIVPPDVTGVDFSDVAQTIIIDAVSSSPTESQIAIARALVTPFVRTGNKDVGALDFQINRIIDESFPNILLPFTLGPGPHFTGRQIFCTVTVGPAATVTFGPEFTKLAGPAIVPNDRIAIRFQYHGANNEVFYETFKI